jgi:hypothetical protein
MTSTNARAFSTKSRCATIATMLLLTAASTSTAKAATITLNHNANQCTFAKAVTSINSRSTQWPCSASGSYGTNDTIVIPNDPNNNTFDINVPITITRSMTVHGAGKWTTNLQSTADFGSQVIHVTNPSAVVKMDNLQLAAGAANNDIGIYVEGESDTNLNDNNLELSYVIVVNFGNTGLLNFGGRVLVQNTLIYLNYGEWGGGVQNVNGLTGANTWWVAKFVAKNSAISFNTASRGGGVWSNGRLDLESTILQQNYSTGDGGAVWVTVVAGVPSPSCKVGTVAGSYPSEFDSNIADSGYSIVSSTIACPMTGAIGTGNTSPYCSGLVTGCPQ